jgi:hypothetical protein
MITKNALELAQKAREAHGKESIELSKQAFDLLFAECTPTREEFIDFSSGLVLGGGTCWELILRVRDWQGAK